MITRQGHQVALLLRQPEEGCGVPLPGPFALPCLGKAVRGVLADRLQQPVAGPVLGRLGGHQRFAGQPVDHLQGRRLVTAGADLDHLR